MINYILLFIIYFALTSILHRLFNKPLSEIERFQAQKWKAVKVETMSISEWANKPRKTPPYLKSAIDQIQDDKNEKVVLLQGEEREAFIKGVQCGGNWFLVHPDGTQEEIDENRISSAGMAEFKQQYLANPWKSALSIPTEKRTAFEQWKASDPANTWIPWWLDERSMKSMPESCIYEYKIEQPETQRKAFEAGVKAGHKEILDMAKNHKLFK